MSFGNFSLSICLDSYSIVYSLAKYVKPQPTKKCHVYFIIFFYRVNISADNFHSALIEVPASDVSSQHIIYIRFHICFTMAAISNALKIDKRRSKAFRNNIFDCKLSPVVSNIWLLRVSICNRRMH